MVTRIIIADTSFRRMTWVGSMHTLGEACYFGVSTGARPFFAAAGYPCPDHENLADFLLDTTTIDPRTPKLLEESVSRVNAIKGVYAGSEQRELALQWVDECNAFAKGPNSMDSANQRKGWNLYWGEEFLILLSRAFKLIVREPRTTKAAVGQAVFVS